MPDDATSGRTVTLWWTSLHDHADAIEAASDRLDDAECRRAARFSVEGGRLRYLAAHTMLRTLMGKKLGVDPQALAFSEGVRGKPSLTAPRVHPTPWFNLSHSGDLAVVALSDSEVGVDVEMIRSVPKLDRLAKRFYSDAERRRLSQSAKGRREADFLAIWTAKEAYLKAVGSGVAMPLKAIEVNPDGPSLDRIARDPHAAAEWTLLSTTLIGAAVCTVAVRGPDWRLVVREFDWGAKPAHQS
jgi:4'-phosphopantetheinyl transferase